jgi:hypothetical protein
MKKSEVAKKQKITRQKANSRAVKANSIHCMSVSMSKNANSDMLKDHMAVFVQCKEFFSDELQKHVAATLGQSLLVQANSNASRPSQEQIAAGPAELLDSDGKSDEETEAARPAAAPAAPASAQESEVVAPAAATDENNSNSN